MKSDGGYLKREEIANRQFWQASVIISATESTEINEMSKYFSVISVAK